MSTVRRVTVTLATPASDMAQEEIAKQVAFLGSGIANVSFADASTLGFDADEAQADALADAARALAERMQRSLRSLKRKIVFRSRAMDAPRFAPAASVDGLSFEGDGLAVLEGPALALFDYFDRCFADFGLGWKPQPMRAPTLIPATVLARCDYFRSFPHSVTFACHLPEDPPRVEDFRRRHQDRDSLDERAMADMVTPEACLSPAVCYHAYAANHDRELAENPLVYSMVGKCFRYESSNMRDLRRLWDFTMRELVFLGDRESVLAERTRGIEAFQGFLDTHGLAGEIRTASDPFFIAPDSAAKTYFQISSETKFEISLLLPGDERLAVGSFNYHGDFFGKSFRVSVAGGLPMHSVCFAWGLERWVYAFLAQHGGDPARWPEPVRQALERG